MVLRGRESPRRTDRSGLDEVALDVGGDVTRDVDEGARGGGAVAVAVPDDAEARLVFGALIDVLDGVRSEELGHLPAPQLEALEVALLRRAAYADGAATWLETVATRSGAAEDGR